MVTISTWVRKRKKKKTIGLKVVVVGVMGARDWMRYSATVNNYVIIKVAVGFVLKQKDLRIRRAKNIVDFLVSISY